MPGKRHGTVAVLGAGQCGRMTAQRLAESDVYQRIVLTDIIPGLAEGIALDLNQSRAITGFETTVEGHRMRTGGDCACISDAQIVVIAAGVVSSAQEPGRTSRMVGELCAQIALHSPEAVIVVLSNPVDALTALARAVTGFPAHRVLGQSVLLDSARFADFTATLLGVPRSAVQLTMVGSHAHDSTMIPLLSGATVYGVPLTSLLSEEDQATLTAAVRRGGADVMKLLGTGSSFYAASAATARMVRAIHDDDGTVLPVCAYVDGEYGVHDVFLGVPALLGRSGVRRVVQLPLSPGEQAALATAAEVMRARQRQCIEQWKE
ncbi:malate dehydrogenase [Amycolatopsis pithecellobii]|uniref:Malate dehydrogenase n=1 Tax=Amycolatopsis pithecellobii TaxID=664692 RepID=A0A6N7YKP0_9PSEU|nr:malate dehydrogenase [Amycolatopsis pithecellobii]MTD52582.1 malate dehydrogenase [Amycolatopsis pithecellobii]